MASDNYGERLATLEAKFEAISDYIKTHPEVHEALDEKISKSVEQASIMQSDIKLILQKMEYMTEMRKQEMEERKEKKETRFRMTDIIIAIIGIVIVLLQLFPPK